MRGARGRLSAAALMLSLLAFTLACGGLEDDAPPPPPPPSPAAPAVETPEANPRRAAAPTPTSPRVLGCVPSTAVNSSMTPVELYPAMAECARAGRVDDAVFLFALGGVYGRFDTLRVRLRQGHGAPTILRSGAIQSVPEAKWTAVRTRVTAVTSAPPQLLALCANVRAAGAPRYHPQYMITHGSSVFLPTTQDPLVDPFDAPAAWEQALEAYLHCPAAQ